MKPVLVIDKNSYKDILAERIREGEAILASYEKLVTAIRFEPIERRADIWNEYNADWLEHIFTEPKNNFATGYINAGAIDTTRSQAVLQGRAPDSEQFRFDFFTTWFVPKLKFMQSLLARAEFVVIKDAAGQLAMNSEEIIKNQAREAVTIAERYGIHNHQGKYVEALREQSLKLYQPDAKAAYFQEAIRLVKEKIAAHRVACKEGPGCPTEKKYEEAIFFLQQELDALPKPAPATTVAYVLPPAIPSTEVEKIFISHSSKDAAIVEEVIDLLEVVGIEPQQIFCSSFEGYSIGLGQDFLQRIKEELNSNVLVLFVITPNFYSSPVSLCEMGAAWVNTNKHIPIVVPPLSYEDVKGVIPLTQGFKINEALKWNTLKEQLEQWFKIRHTTPASVWERKRDKAIQAINNKIQEPAPPLQRAKVRDLKRGGSTSVI